MTSHRQNNQAKTKHTHAQRCASKNKVAQSRRLSRKVRFCLLCFPQFLKNSSSFCKRNLKIVLVFSVHIINYRFAERPKWIENPDYSFRVRYISLIHLFFENLIWFLLFCARLLFYAKNTIQRDYSGKFLWTNRVSFTSHTWRLH